MESVLSARRVVRRFDTSQTPVVALGGVDIEIPRGKFVVLQGPSGSGKTTLMNIFGALDVPTEGEVFFDGDRLDSLSEHRRDLIRRNRYGFVFQSVALIAMMSAYENVELALRIAGYEPKQRRERAEQCLAAVGMAKRMKHKPGELSGGEQQRAAIARAIAHRPSVLFADEPTAELDSHLALQVIKVFTHLVETEGLTIVMSSHDANLRELADVVIELEDGMVKDVRTR